MTTILGLDPGARATGWCQLLTRDNALLSAGVITNHGHLTCDATLTTYLDDITSTIMELHPTLIALESVTAPKGFKDGKRAPINPEAMAGLGAAWATIVRTAANQGVRVVHVRPDRHGSRLLGAYPRPLVSAGERARPGWEQRVGTGELRHARSAYDVACTALTLTLTAEVSA